MTATLPARARGQPVDAVVGCLREGGLSIEMTAHAYAILDSFIYGIAFQEANLPAHGEGEEFAEIARHIAANFPADAYPHLAELTFEHVLQPGYNFSDSFDLGLDLIIDGIDQAAQAH